MIELVVFMAAVVFGIIFIAVIVACYNAMKLAFRVLDKEQEKSDLEYYYNKYYDHFAKDKKDSEDKKDEC